MDTAEQRSKRYVQSEEEFCKSSNFNQIRPFFDGDLLTKRMSKIREGIVYIRENWSNYDHFVMLVHKYVNENVQDSEAKVMMQKLLVKKKDWAESGEDVSEDFDAVRLYTSVKGYDEIFWLINRVFRDLGSTANEDLIKTAVFIIELINIDLFNYCLYDKRFANFTGVVYRGMAIMESDMEDYQTLRTKPIPSRFIATPLSLSSSSVSLTQASQFIARQLEARGDESKPIMMKIHVINLEQKYLQYYKQRFPSSIVSTICAVDIQSISDLPDEKEVLLRGPFFQVLEFYDGHVIHNKTCKILEMVMVNANRDHISTSQLGQDGGLARQLFGNMVGASRCRFAISYYDERGQFDDAQEYRKELNDKLDKLEELMKQ